MEIHHESGCCFCGPWFPQAETQSVRNFEQRYNVSVIWQEPTFPISISGGIVSGSDAGDNARKYLPLLIREFSIYPATFVRRSKLKRIVVCKDLAFENQKRAAVPDFAAATLYLDCERGKHSTIYQRSVIHHEFFHMVDYIDDGLLYKDRSWSALNRADFRYGAGGAAQQNSDQSAFRTPSAGFLTNYSTAGVEEDKAELFAHLGSSEQ